MSNKVNDERLVAMVMALAAVGYTQTAIATMLHVSRDSVRRIGWVTAGVVFGTKTLPKKWLKEIDWVSREPVNLQPMAKKIFDWVEIKPDLALETILAVHPMLDSQTGARWLLEASRGASALRKIATRAANICRGH